MKESTSTPEYWKATAPIPPLGKLDYTNLKNSLLEAFQIIESSATIDNIRVVEKVHFDDSKDLITMVGPTVRKKLPNGADFGLRHRFKTEYYKLLGVWPPYLSSGWGKREDGTDISYEELYKQ